jgi:hypothetical protein
LELISVQPDPNETVSETNVVPPSTPLDGVTEPQPPNALFMVSKILAAFVSGGAAGSIVGSKWNAASATRAA